MNTSAPTRKQSWKDNVQKTRFVMDILLLVSFLIVLANSDFYNRLEYSAIGYNFVDFKIWKY